MDFNANQTTPSVGAALKGRMNYLIARQGVVAGNIANASTPNYLAKDLVFTGALNRAQMELKNTHKSHIVPKKGPTTGKLVSDATHMRNDGNSVEVTEELQKLAEIQIEHRAMTQLVAKYAAFQKMALGRGGQ